METTFNVYYVEVGVLLPKEHKEYADYSNVFDKKHAYYNENSCFFLDKEKAIEFANKYIENGINHTYGIVKELEYNGQKIYGNDTHTEQCIVDDLNCLKEENYIEDYQSIFDNLYDLSGIVYNAVKVYDDIVKKDFIEL